MAKFPAGHAATKKLIASCAANGVGIDSLAESGVYFRFYPTEWGGDSFNGREHGGPSKRGSMVCGKPKPKHIKNWTPARTSLDPHYSTAMAGDDWELTKARRAYAGGDPDPLRKWLRADAEERRGLALLAASPVQLALAA